MTKEERNLLQGIRINSIIEYKNARGYYNYGKVSTIKFVKDFNGHLDNAYLTIVDGLGNLIEIIDVYEVHHIVTCSKIKRSFGVK